MIAEALKLLCRAAVTEHFTIESVVTACCASIVAASQLSTGIFFDNLVATLDLQRFLNNALTRKCWRRSRDFIQNANMWRKDKGKKGLRRDKPKILFDEVRFTFQQNLQKL